MAKKDSIYTIVMLAIVVVGGYLFIKDRYIAPKNISQEDYLAIKQTVEFVSFLDRIHPDEIKVLSSEPAEWPNSCLGLPREEEVCAEALVSGYKITLETDGQIKVFRTNKDGSSIRRDLAI